jgi:hypothetical protein
MPSDSITCPNCRQEIQLTQAVSQQIREQLAQEFEVEKLKQQQLLAEKEQGLLKEAKRLESSRLALESEVASQVRQAKIQLREEALRQAQADSVAQMRELEAKLQEREQQVIQAQKLELELRKQQRELAEKQQALELEVVRRIDEERSRIREVAKRLALEDQRLRLSEKEKIISDLQKQIETLRQKAEQGSQQLQGEVLEIEFEQRLQATFAADEITPVATGIRGADLLQQVRDGVGQPCGSLIWEAKRTRNWNHGWIAKLKEDQRAHCADIAILLTSALPEQVRNFGYVDGVWVTDFNCGLSLAAALRQGLISAANARRVESGKQEKMEVLYNYLSGTEFRQKVEAVVEAFVNMKADLNAEKRAMMKLWAKREKQIEQAVCNTALMYGGVQGIVGQAALPPIQLLELGA